MQPQPAFPRLSDDSRLCFICCSEVGYRLPASGLNSEVMEASRFIAGSCSSRGEVHSLEWQMILIWKGPGGSNIALMSRLLASLFPTYCLVFLCDLHMSFGVSTFHFQLACKNVSFSKGLSIAPKWTALYNSQKNFTNWHSFIFVFFIII